jgi:hypothetical protein
MGRKKRLKPEFDHQPTGVGGQLQARAGFLQPFGSLHNDDTKALSGKREGSG